MTPNRERKAKEPEMKTAHEEIAELDCRIWEREAQDSMSMHPHGVPQAWLNRRAELMATIRAEWQAEYIAKMRARELAE